MRNSMLAALLRVAVVTMIALPATPIRAADFRSNWVNSVDRIWIGPEYFANRLHDWRLRDGRVECVESGRNLPVRSVHLLTHSLGSGESAFDVRVRTGLVDADTDPSGDAWAGFLIGAGGAHVDHRLTALVHHQPAADGGLLAIIDGAGRVAFRDFSRGRARDGQWTVRGPLAPEDAPELSATSRAGDGFELRRSGPVDLHLHGEPSEKGYVLTMTAREAAGGRMVSRATIEGIEPSRVDGCLALVSNGGSRNAGFWFRDWSASGEKLEPHPGRTFGPVLCAMYTLSDGVLKLTAQMPPLGEADNRSATLEVFDGGTWREAARSELIADSYTIPFRIEDWNGSRDVAYRIAYDLKRGGSRERFTYDGTIRAEPRDAAEFVIAAFTGHKVFGGQLHWNHDGIWFPHDDIVSAVAHHDPDLLFFSGDQIYEGDLTPITWRPDERVILDYLYKWSRWCWSFRDLARDRPCITIPDDHDVYHGNIWGAAGVQAPPDPRFSNVQDRGGYKMSTRFVNAVHRTQVSHLPDPVDPKPLDNGVSVYFTRLEYGGVSFAILADRMFKSAPAAVLAEAGIVNGWSRDPEYDPVTEGDAPNARLLGERQIRFLDRWTVDFSHGAWMKVALSQTIFANVATLPRGARNGSVLPSLPITPPDVYPEDHIVVADHDSNGWPQSGRNRALRALRRGLAMHIAGDQHLASTIQYGIDDWGDAGFALCVPSIANAWPRRWFPPEPGLNRKPDSPRNTGDYLDGFGNRMTVLAVANPHRTGHEPSALHDRAPGYGLIRLNPHRRTATIEVWSRFVDPSRPDPSPYPGWPITVRPHDLDERKALGYLAALEIRDLHEPVVQVIDETTGEIVRAMRLMGSRCLLPVHTPGPYTLRIGDPDRPVWRTLRDLTPVPRDEAVADARVVEFESAQ